MARLASSPACSIRATGRQVVAVVGCAVALVGGGCRSSAYNDVYRQKMASEMRVLEDQLYQADYDNRVLHEKLQREALRNEQLEAEYADRRAEESLQRSRSPRLDSEGGSRRDSFGTDDFDLGDDPEALNSQTRGAGRRESDASDNADVPVDPGAPIDPETLEKETEATRDDDDSLSLPPAPGGPEPPGENDLELPPIDPGELVPPPSPDGEPDKPPGQIELPDAVRALSPDGAKIGFPTSMSIHPGLSSGHLFDDGAEGLFLVVNVLDSQRRPLNLEAFDAEAPLTIVAIDPEADPDAARLGRWEFEPEQISALVRNEPVSGLQIPIRWQDRRPLGEHVVVHVRMKNESQEIRCEAKLVVRPAAAVAEWTPRGN